MDLKQDMGITAHSAVVMMYTILCINDRSASHAEQGTHHVQITSTRRRFHIISLLKVRGLLVKGAMCPQDTYKSA